MKSFTDEDIVRFVERESSAWQPIAESLFEGVPAEIATAAIQGDREQLQISRDDLLTVMRQRRDKGAFAKQYELWMTDYTTMILDFLQNPRGETPEIQQAMLAVVKNGLLYKLTAMERWYHTVFTDTPVSETPDKEMMNVADNYHPPKAQQQTGCAIILLAAGVSVGTVLSIALSIAFARGG